MAAPHCISPSRGDAQHDPQAQACIDLLLDQSDLSLRSAGGQTLLMAADASALPWFLPYVDVNETDAAGCNALFHACKEGNNEKVAILLPLSGAVSLTRMRDANGGTALACATSRSFKADTLRLLVASGCDPKELCDDGSTALHWVAATGQIEAIRFLALVSELDALNGSGRSALTIAVETGRKEAAQLLALGCDPCAGIRASEDVLEAAAQGATRKASRAPGNLPTPERGL